MTHTPKRQKRKPTNYVLRKTQDEANRCLTLGRLSYTRREFVLIIDEKSEEDGYHINACITVDLKHAINMRNWLNRFIYWAEQEERKE